MRVKKQGNSNGHLIPIPEKLEKGNFNRHSIPINKKLKKSWKELCENLTLNFSDRIKKEKVGNEKTQTFDEFLTESQTNVEQLLGEAQKIFSEVNSFKDSKLNKMNRGDKSANDSEIKIIKIIKSKINAIEKSLEKIKKELENGIEHVQLNTQIDIQTKKIDIKNKEEKIEQSFTHHVKEFHKSMNKRIKKETEKIKILNQKAADLIFLLKSLNQIEKILKDNQFCLKQKINPDRNIEEIRKLLFEGKIKHAGN